ATINTSPDRASVATQMTSPSASNFGAKAWPSSTSSVEPRWAKGESSSDKESLAQKSKIVVGRAGVRPSTRPAWGRRIISGSRAGTMPARAGHDLRLRRWARCSRRGSAIRPAHHGDEADLIVGIVPEAAGKLRGNGGRSRLLHPAQRHAHVLG